jgi:hypothetical protein
MKKIFEKGSGFIWIEMINTEIDWWKHHDGVFIYPAIILSRTGNTKGFKIKFLRWTICISYFFERRNKLKTILDGLSK